MVNFFNVSREAVMVAENSSVCLRLDKLEIMVLRSLEINHTYVIHVTIR